MQFPITKWFDVRPGEGRLVAAAAALLFATIAGHTLLETARDALFLKELKPSSLALVYAALALFAVLAARGSTALCKLQGERRALGLSLVAGVLGAIGFFLAPKTHAVVFALYLWTGVLTSVAVAQFWMLAARVFTIAQAKRLVGPIASAGILGGVVGGACAVALLGTLTTSQLLPAAAALFALALIPLRFVQSDVNAPESEPPALVEAVASDTSDEAPVGRRYLGLVTGLIAVSTMTLLCIDYIFKTSAARELPSAELGAFFARFYAILNLVAFVFQLVLATQLLRRLGVLAAVAILPMLLVLGSVMTFVIGPALGIVLLVKGADGGLRHSLHRTSTELLWMPLPARVRGDAKPLVDTFVVRLSQALAAAGVFGLAWWGLDTPRVLAAAIALLALSWIVLTLLLRHPYLALFRIALQRDRELDGPLRFTMGSLEVLMEALSSMNPARATAAIHLLASHGRARLIPALTLFHPAPEVVLSALKHVPAPDRTDWIEPTERLIDHESEEVRIAAMGALADHGVRAPLERRLAGDNPILRGHAVALLAERAPGLPHLNASVRALLAVSGAAAVPDKVALLRAIRGRPGWVELVVGLLEDEAAEVSEAAVVCAATLRNDALIEPLLRRLALRKERDLAREALAAQGSPALEAAARWLASADTPPRVRRHLPRTISRFACQRAAEILLELLASEPEGTIRYKALRGLGRLASETPVELDRSFLEQLLEDNLSESLRMRSVHFTIGSELAARGSGTETGAQLLLDLLSDKADQAAERAFRILQLLHPQENVRVVAEAVVTGDKASHARALEYLSTLTLDLGQKTRELLRLVVDDLEPNVRTELAKSELPSIPETHDQAIEALKRSGDDALASVAAYYDERCGGTASKPLRRTTTAREAVASDHTLPAITPRSEHVR